MMRAMWSRSRLMAGVLAVAIGLAAPAFAQSTGMVKGKVVDANKQPVEGAKVAIEFTEGVTRKFEVKTNKKGEYIQIGLQPGRYKITATKDGVGTASQEAKISIGATEQVDLTLAAGAAGGSLSKEEEAFRKTFSEGVEANKKGEHDAAIAKFTEALKLRPDCYACQFNIGGSHLSKQEYDKAEAAFKAAGTMNPNSAEPYNALANLYNAQKKYDQAAAMTSEAMKRGGASGASGGTGGASPEVLYNQGVMLMNAQKTAEANAQFAAATKAKPDYADAYYMLGLTSLQLFAMQQQEAKKAEAIAAFEKYLQLDPTGKYANEVKSTIASLKQ
jgi:tetratricopeptide (TPR) repeat protein